MKLEEVHIIDKTIDSYKVYYDDIDISYIARQHYITLLRNKDNKGNKPIVVDKSIILRLLKGFLLTFVYLFKKKDYWVFSNAERRKKIDKYYVDRVGSIVSEIKKNTLFIENPVLVNHKKPTRDLILSDAVFYFFSLIFSLIYYRKDKLFVDEGLKDFAKKENLNLNIEPLIKRFIGQYKFMSFYLKYFHKPKVVFSVYPGGYLGYNYAFKEHNIPVVELQHGVIYPLHFSYNTILFKKSELFKPDYIFTYGKKDKECLEELNFLKKDKIFVVGSYGLQKVKDNDIEKAGQYLKEIIGKDKIISIIATVNDVNELYDFALKLENESSHNYKILLLPRHSVKLPDTKNVKVLDIQKTNIFEVYKVSNYLLTKASTAALEAMYMELPVFVYEDSNELSLFKRNYSYIKSLNYINTPDELINKISNKNYSVPQDDDVESVFSTNIYKNFSKALEKVENGYI